MLKKLRQVLDSLLVLAGLGGLCFIAAVLLTTLVEATLSFVLTPLFHWPKPSLGALFLTIFIGCIVLMIYVAAQLSKDDEKQQEAEAKRQVDRQEMTRLSEMIDRLRKEVEQKQ